MALHIVAEGTDAQRIQSALSCQYAGTGREGLAFRGSILHIEEKFSNDIGVSPRVHGGQRYCLDTIAEAGAGRYDLGHTIGLCNERSRDADA